MSITDQQASEAIKTILQPFDELAIKQRARQALIARLAESIRLSWPEVSHRSEGGGVQDGESYAKLKLSIQVDVAEVAKQARVTFIDDSVLCDAVEEWARREASESMVVVTEVMLTGQRVEIVNGIACLAWDVEVVGSE